ncbi:MAG: DUF2160 domain-containing protein [Paracoccaceae bacterium]
MAWTWQTGTFFGCIACLIAIMGAWEYIRPGGSPRTPGALGISTTRGDRLFISLLTAAYVHLAWLGLGLGALFGATLGFLGLGDLLPGVIPLWGATLISLVLMLAIFRWV